MSIDISKFINYAEHFESSPIKTNPYKVAHDVDSFEFIAKKPGESLVAIDNCDDLNKDNLINIKIEHAILIGFKVIANNLFENRLELKSLDFSDGTKELGYQLCKGDLNLSSIYLPESIFKIGFSCFENCENLSSINIPNRIHSLDNFTFYNCKSLKRITGGIQLNTIGQNCFENCDALSSISFINLVNVNDSGFRNCKNLKSIDLPKLESVGNWAFDNCSALKDKIYLPKIKSIGSNSFQNCSELSSIHFGIDLDSIGDSAFYNCYKLKAIRYGYFENDEDDIKYNSKELSAHKIPELLDDKFTFTNINPDWTITVPPYMYWNFIEHPVWKKYGNPLWNPEDRDLSVLTENQHIVTTKVLGKYDIVMQPNSSYFVEYDDNVSDDGLNTTDIKINYAKKNIADQDMKVTVVKIIDKVNLKEPEIIHPDVTQRDSYIVYEGNNVKAGHIEKMNSSDFLSVYVVTHDSLNDIAVN